MFLSFLMTPYPIFVRLVDSKKTVDQTEKKKDQLWYVPVLFDVLQKADIESLHINSK